MICLSGLLQPEEQPMTDPSSSERQITEGDYFQNGGKDKCNVLLSYLARLFLICHSFYMVDLFMTTKLPINPLPQKIVLLQCSSALKIKRFINHFPFKALIVYACYGKQQPVIFFFSSRACYFRKQSMVGLLFLKIHQVFSEITSSR